MNEPATGTGARVAIVLLNWNGWRDTEECLDSLLRLDYRPFTVWIFDNGSSDESVTRLAAWGRQAHALGPSDWRDGRFFARTFPDLTVGAPDAHVVLFTNGENLGFAGGVNRACEVAVKSDIEYLWLLNNDSVVQSDTLESLVSCARSAPGSPVGSMVLHAAEDSANQRIAFARGQLPRDLLFRRQVRDRDEPQERSWPSDWTSFASVLIPMNLVRNRLSEDGFLLDPALFMYVEDVEFGLYCRSIGRTTVVSRDGAVVHKEAASSGGRGNPRSFYYITRNRLLVARKWFQPIGFLAFAAAYSASRAMLVANHLLKRRWAVAGSVAAGTIDGLMGRHGRWTRH